MYKKNSGPFYMYVLINIYLFLILIELLQVQMTLTNPLNISLCIENLSLTYSFDKELTFVEPQVLDELLLTSSSTTQVFYTIIKIIKSISITFVLF